MHFLCLDASLDPTLSWTDAEQCRCGRTYAELEELCNLANNAFKIHTRFETARPRMLGGMVATSLSMPRVVLAIEQGRKRQEFHARKK